MSVDRRGETEADLVDRRGREAERRFRAHMRRITAHRALGTNIDMGPAIPSQISFAPRRWP